MIQAAQGDLAVVQALLSSDATVDTKDKNGVTALMAASFNGHLDVVQALLSLNDPLKIKFKKMN